MLMDPEHKMFSVWLVCLWVISAVISMSMFAGCIYIALWMLKHFGVI